MVGYIGGVRIRFPELLEEKKLTPYSLSKRTDGKISLSTAYRLKRLKGRVKTFDAQMLEILYDAFACGSLEELLERDIKRRGKG
jgi:hypothetical protein